MGAQKCDCAPVIIDRLSYGLNRNFLRSVRERVDLDPISCRHADVAVNNLYYHPPALMFFHVSCSSVPSMYVPFGDFLVILTSASNWTAHVFFGRRGNNPYCYHRAAEQARVGIRERLTVKECATGVPFDHAIFEIEEEPARSPWPSQDAFRFTPDRIQWNSEKAPTVPFRVLS
jgi:hypothetical protein